MSEPTVHIVDDDDDAREALAFMLEASDFTVRAYPSAPAFLQALPGGVSGCVITDVRMPDMTGLELVQRLKDLGSGLPVIVMTGHGDIPMAVDAMRSGIADFLEKPFSEQRVLEALNRALAGAPVGEAAGQARDAVRQRLETLSERERQVLDRVVAGQANKVIARDLGISPRTVEIYRAKLMAKMQADSLAGLVRMTLMVERAP